MTLFELSVVVVIAAILGGIAFLSSRTLVSRTKASRVLQEQRAVSRALQNYMMDYSALPPASTGLVALTQPTVYLPSVPSDPFQPAATPYLYLATESRDVAALIVSPGPDGRFDLPPELWRFASVPEAEPVAVNLKPGPADAIIRFARIRRESRSAKGALASEEPVPMTEAEAAILATYLRLGRYDAATGGAGDIVTVIRY